MSRLLLQEVSFRNRAAIWLGKGAGHPRNVEFRQLIMDTARVF